MSRCSHCSTLPNEGWLESSGNPTLNCDNKRYYARVQDDGNFVVYNSSNFSASNAMWSSKTNGKGDGPYKLVMQDDGNLCLYDRNGTCTWASQTPHKGSGPYRLTMQTDGNLVVYDRYDTPTWASNTCR